MTDKLYCSVRIIDIAYHADKGYAYLVPPGIRAGIRRGSTVLVPFGSGNRLRKGLVTAFSDHCEYPSVKPVAELLDDYGLITDETVDLCLFMAERCFCTVGAALRTVLPPGIDSGAETYYTAAEYDISGFNDRAQVLYRFIAEKERTEDDIWYSFGEEASAAVSRLVKLGAVIRKQRPREKINEKNASCVRLAVDPDTAYSLCRGEKQRALVDALVLEEELTVAELERFFGVSRSVVGSMCRKSACEITTRREERPTFEPDGREKSIFPLTDEQSEAVHTVDSLLDSGEPKAALLFGVTGSGKTRVIIEAVKSTLASGRSAIVLIPEIGLTSEAVGIYAAEFGDTLAVIHSMLSVGERIDAARSIADGKKRVIIGTRSAVFAPVSRLGLIAIDEEQEHTYKSDRSPKYHARDIARFRCSKNSALMLLASATPSVESYYKAKQGIYTLITMKSRCGNAAMPKTVVADIKNDPRCISGKLIGETLSEKLKQSKEAGLQSILYVGRRGYNAFVSCQSCGTVLNCPNCSVSLTYHAFSAERRRSERLMCHYCGYTVPLPDSCPSCGKRSIARFGFGTQKLQDELETDYPSLRSIRMDTDTTATRHSHENRFGAFRRHEADTLYGTQMIAKGLDFPLVSLVGVISVDALLYQNDFRAAERTFSLLTQLSGRAGRAGAEGEAVLQTSNPQSEILKQVCEQDYEKFFDGDIRMRRAVIFPPFCEIAIFRISGENERETRQAASSFSVMFDRKLAGEYPDLEMIRFGPFNEGIYRMGNRYRQRLVVKYRDCAAARSLFRQCICEFAASDRTGARLDIDINPTVV